MQFYNVAIEMAHETTCTSPVMDWAGVEVETSVLPPVPRGLYVGAQQSEVVNFHENAERVRIRRLNTEFSSNPHGCAGIATGSGPIGPVAFPNSSDAGRLPCVIRAGVRLSM